MFCIDLLTKPRKTAESAAAEQDVPKPREAFAAGTVSSVRVPSELKRSSNAYLQGSSAFTSNSALILTSDLHLKTDEIGFKSINQYLITSDIGKGRTSKLKLCVRMDTGEVLAVKIRPKTAIGGPPLWDEFPHIVSLQHNHILSWYEVIDDPLHHCTYTVMEYSENGPITVVDEGSGTCMPTYSSEEAAGYVVQIAEALSYLHDDLGVSHRCVKPSNILLAKDKSIKLSDCGVVSRPHFTAPTGRESGLVVIGMACAPYYCPPESFSDTEYSGEAADMWGLGLTLYCLVFGRLPFFASSFAELKYKIMQEKLVFPDGCDPSLAGIISSLLERDPTRRMLLRDVFSHPFVAQHIPEQWRKERESTEGDGVNFVRLKETAVLSGPDWAELETGDKSPGLQQKRSKVGQRIHWQSSHTDRKQMSKPQRRRYDVLKDENFESVPRPASPPADENSHTQVTSSVMEVKDAAGLRYVNHYMVMHKLGQGRSGKVRFCINTNNGKVQAIKICKKSLLELRGDLDDLKMELAIIKKLNHRNVLACKEVIDDLTHDKLFMIFEFAALGSITVVDEVSGVCSRTFPVPMVIDFTRQMVEGLYYLHSVDVVHRDIKPSNVVLDENGTIKIADFCVSILLAGREDVMQETAGTPAFNPPETFSSLEYAGKPADVWGLGIVVYCILFGKIPFFGLSYREIKNAILYSEPLIPPETDSLIVDFIEGSLNKNPNKRYSIGEMREHPWLTGKGQAAIASRRAKEPEPLEITPSDVNNAITISDVPVVSAFQNQDDFVFNTVQVVAEDGTGVIPNSTEEEGNNRSDWSF